MKSPASAMLVAGALLFASPESGSTQQPCGDQESGECSAPAQARPEDFATLDTILAAFYDVISGPPGQPRQWERDRALYIPDVRFVAMRVEEGKPRADVMDHDAFVREVNDYMVREGFFEREIHRVVRTFGKVTHVFSTYEMRNAEDGPVIGRGVNSLQLFHDGHRWWIASVAWDDEGPDNPIPPELLPG